MSRDLVPLPPPLPAVLAELRRHINACPLCTAKKGCRTGVALTARWLQYEADENGIRAKIVPDGDAP